jgi:hypothetical protein
VKPEVKGRVGKSKGHIKTGQGGLAHNPGGHKKNNMVAANSNLKKKHS